MSFKHFYAIVALAFGCLLASCHSELDLTNIDPKAEVNMGLALPVGNLHVTLGDVLGAGFGYLYIDSLDNRGVITWKDTFHIARDFHKLDLKDYVSSKDLDLKVYDKLAADGFIIVQSGDTKIVNGIGQQATLQFPMPLKMEGINHPDSLYKMRLDSALIEIASFTSIIDTTNLPLKWEWIDSVVLELGTGQQIRREKGPNVTVYKKGDPKFASFNYGAPIETMIDDFTIRLIEGNLETGNWKTLDSCMFYVDFCFTIPVGESVKLQSNSAFAYHLGVQFIDYAAVWGKFQHSKEMYDESEFDISENWGSLEFLSNSSLPFADPRIDMHIVTQVAGAMKIQGDYLYSLDAFGARHYAEFTRGSDVFQDFYKQFEKGEYLEPLTSQVGDSTTNMLVVFDKDPARGHIDKMFEVMPQKLGYKFDIDFNYQMTPQIRITPNTSIRIDAICTLPFIFGRGLMFLYQDTVEDVNLSQFRLDSLLGEVNLIDTLKATDLSIVLSAKNSIPLDVMANMRCIDANGDTIMDPADPTKPYLLFKQDTIRLDAAKFALEGGTWKMSQLGETDIVVRVTKEELDLFPSIKKIIYMVHVNDASLQEIYEKGMSNIRITEDQGLTIKIGLAADVDAVLNFGKSNNQQ